jgi:hypothetical protein
LSVASTSSGKPSPHHPTHVPEREPEPASTVLGRCLLGLPLFCCIDAGATALRLAERRAVDVVTMGIEVVVELGLVGVLLLWWRRSNARGKQWMIATLALSVVVSMSALGHHGYAEDAGARPAHQFPAATFLVLVGFLWVIATPAMYRRAVRQATAAVDVDAPADGD